MRAQASFNPKRQDVVKDAFFICIANSVFSLVSAMTVFSVLGFMATEQRVCVADVTEGGPGLAFVAFPKALSMMPGSNFFSLLFFLMLIFLGIDSAFSMAEALSTAVTESMSGANLPPFRSRPQAIFVSLERVLFFRFRCLLLRVVGWPWPVAHSLNSHGCHVMCRSDAGRMASAGGDLRRGLCARRCLLL